MTTDHDLLARIDERITELQNGINLVESNGFLGTNRLFVQNSKSELLFMLALRAVVELHKPYTWQKYVSCSACEVNSSGEYSTPYPCPTIQAIEKEMGCN